MARKTFGTMPELSDTSPRGIPSWYTICGMTVCSEVPLPIPPMARTEQVAPAWVIRRAELGPRSPITTSAARDEARRGRSAEEAALAYTFYRGLTGYWWWWDFGAFHVSPDARLVEVSPEPDADERELGIALIGPVAEFILYQLGVPTLHSSAIATQAGAVSFLGGSGQGKSTMAAAFLRRGAEILADDALPLEAFEDGVYGAPSLPIMKLWQPTAERTLGLKSEELANLTSSTEKKLFWLEGQPLAACPVPMRAMYVLDRYNPAEAGESQVTVRGLAGRTGLAAILAQLSCAELLQPREVRRFLPLFARLAAQAPVRVLRYPSGFEYQDLVCDCVMRDLVTT